MGILRPRSIAFILGGIVVGMAAFLLLYHLGAEPLQDYDEATYAEVSHEAATSGDQSSLTLFGQPYFRKPPLLFWMIEASGHVTPNAETAARLPSALAALGLVILVMVFMLEAGAAPITAVFAGAILTTIGAFIEAARQSRFDTLVTLFDVAAVYAFLRAMRGGRERRWLLLFGAFLGLAVLSKGVLVVYALAGALAISVAHRQWRWITDPYFWGGAFVGACIALPWHLYETFQFGTTFWREYLGVEVFDRVKQDLFGGGGPTNWEYVQYLTAFGTPWFLVWCINLLKLPFVWKNLSFHKRAAYVGVLSATVSILVILFITKTKALTYLVPLYPFAAITIALTIEALVPYLTDARLRTVLYTACVTLIVCGFSFSVYNGFHINPYYASMLQHANEEKAAALRIRATDPDAVLYEYGENDIGSLQFYSQSYPVYLYSADSVLPPHSFIILNPIDRAALDTVKSRTDFTEIYTGSFVEIVSATTT